MAAGPEAAGILQRELQLRGFEVTLAPSPWQIDRSETALIQALATGSAAAVRETRLISAQDVDLWLAARHKAEHCTVGHWDILATPF